MSMMSLIVELKHCDHWFIAKLWNLIDKKQTTARNVRHNVQSASMLYPIDVIKYTTQVDSDNSL